MKRVLVVGPVPPPEGGIASVLGDLVSSDLSASYRFDIFPRQPSLPAGLHGPFRRNGYRIRRFLRFFGMVLRERYCLAHIHSPDNAFLGTVIFTALAGLAGVPVLLHLHGTDWQSFYPDAPLCRKIYTRLGLLIPRTVLVLYSMWEREIRKIVPRAHVEVLRNMVHDTEPPGSEEMETVRQQLGLAPSDFLVLTVGSVGRRKGSFEILEAASDLAPGCSAVRFVLVGGEEKPGERAQLERMLHDRGLEQSVLLAGEVPRGRIPHLLAAADAFLLPSYYEGMPISLLEAMRAGLAIVTTPVAGIPEMLTTEESALFIQPGSPAQIVDATLRLRDDADLRSRLGRTARAVFEEKFEFSRGIKHLRQVYQASARKTEHTIS